MPGGISISLPVDAADDLLRGAGHLFGDVGHLVSTPFRAAVPRGTSDTSVPPTDAAAPAAIAPAAMGASSPKFAAAPVAASMPITASLGWPAGPMDGSAAPAAAPISPAAPASSGSRHPKALRILGHIGDALGTMFAPAAMAVIPGTTLNKEYQQGIRAAQMRDQADVAHLNAETQEAQRMANAPPPESPNVGKTVTVNGRLMQFDPRTQGYDVDLGSAKPTDDWVADPTNGVEINRATGEIRAMTVGGKPVDLPSTPERDKQRMQTLEQSLAAGTISDADRATLRQLQSDAKLTGTKPEIIAQVGPPPVAADYPKGSADPKYKADEQAWGKAYEKVFNDEASASGFAHGAGYNATRPVPVFDPATGTFVYESAQQAEQRGAAPANIANNVMGRQAQIGDIVSGSKALRTALTAPGLAPFSPKQTAQLSLAMRDVDPGAMRNAVTDFMASGLSPEQQDLVAALFSMQERALALRSVAGMGQGSDTVRHAIIKALPNITSGSTSLALKQLDVFDNLVGNIAKGIGGIKGSAAAPADRSTGGTKAPSVGSVEDGYRFKGGDPANQSSWEKVK